MQLPVIAHMVTLIRQGKVKGKTYLEFAFDVLHVVYKNYNDPSKVLPLILESVRYQIQLR